MEILLISHPDLTFGWLLCIPNKNRLHFITENFGVILDVNILSLDPKFYEEC